MENSALYAKIVFSSSPGSPRGRPPGEKAQSVTLYTLGLSMNAIAKFIGVSATTILNWIRKFAIENYEKPTPSGAILVEIDEMWHYLKKRKINFGYGKRIAGKLASLSTGNVVVVIRRLCQN